MRRERKSIGLRVRLISTPTIDNARNDGQNVTETDRSDRSDENVNENVTESNNSNVGRNVVCRDVLFDDSAQDVISALGAPGMSLMQFLCELF